MLNSFDVRARYFEILRIGYQIYTTSHPKNIFAPV